jgi:hypothetical protein
MQLRDDDDDAPAEFACVTGEIARNRIAPNGQEAATNGVFETIEQGEAFICLDVPQLPEIDGWEVHNVNAERSHSLDHFKPGMFTTDDNGYRFLGIGYLNPRLDGLIMFDFTVYPADYLSHLSAGAIGVIGPDESCVMARLPLIGDFELLDETEATVNGAQAIIQVYLEPEGRGRSQDLFVCWQEGALIYSAYARYGEPLEYRRDILPILELVE